MIWQPEFTDKTLSRKPGAVQLRKLRYRVILQYKKYTIFRKLIVPCAIFKILLLIVVAPSFLCTFRIAHRILGTKNPRIGGLISSVAM
ncbi:hypothetical protein C5F57_28890 [Escherichia coli]|nr:hypothetical protein C5F57_28890 [Escherichia coli]